MEKQPLCVFGYVKITLVTLCPHNLHFDVMNSEGKDVKMG
jgi:hypothetical protein